jgi:hypothetical protein
VPAAQALSPEITKAIGALQQYLTQGLGQEQGRMIARQLTEALIGQGGAAHQQNLVQLTQIPPAQRGEAFFQILTGMAGSQLEPSLQPQIAQLFAPQAGQLVMQDFLTSLTLPRHAPFQLPQTLAGSEGGALLKTLVENLGINMEQLLARGDTRAAQATLKAALLELATLFTSAERLADTTTKIITTLELFQLTQLHANSESHTIFPLPLPFVEQGYLVFERGEEGQGGEAGTREHKFSLHLTMTELGNLQIDFLQTADSLLIRFRAEDQQRVAFLQDYSAELEESIAAVETIHLVFSGDAPDPIQDLVKEMLPEGSQILDTSV